MFIPQEGEINNSPSLTVPDEAISISELVIRFAKGMPIGDGKEMLYDGDENDAPETVELRKLDLTERKALLDEAKVQIDDARKAQEERRKAAEQARFEKMVESRVNEKLQKRKQLEQLKMELGEDKTVE